MKKDDTPSFDFGALDATPLDGSEARQPTEMRRDDHTDSGNSLVTTRDVASSAPWHEVPQARFLSWSDAMQAAYCRDRDLDSAEHAESLWWAEFYLQRAKCYQNL